MSVSTDDYLANRFLEENPEKTFMNEAGSRIYYMLDGSMTCYYAQPNFNFRMADASDMIDVFRFIKEQQSL